MQNVINWPAGLKEKCDKAILLRNGYVVAVQYENNGNIIAFSGSQQENGRSIGIDFPANTETKEPLLNFAGRGTYTLDHFDIFHIEVIAVACVYNGWWPVIGDTQLLYKQDNTYDPDSWPQNFPNEAGLTIAYLNQATIIAIQQQGYAPVNNESGNLVSFNDVPIKDTKLLEILHIESSDPWEGWPPHDPFTCWGYC